METEAKLPYPTHFILFYFILYNINIYISLVIIYYYYVLLFNIIYCYLILYTEKLSLPVVERPLAGNSQVRVVRSFHGLENGKETSISKAYCQLISDAESFVCIKKEKGREGREGREENE